MSGFAGQGSRPWMGGDATASGDVRDDAAAVSSMRGLGATSTNASAISFGFAATAILVSMFLLMAIFEHLIKPSWSSSRGSNDGGSDSQSAHSGRHAHGDAGSPGKLTRADKMEAVVQAEDLTVLMPGQRYPTFLAMPAPLLPCPREGVRWPRHDHHRHSMVPP